MIKTPELEQALLVLPFSQVESMAKFLVRLLAAGLEVELCARCAVFLLRVHQVHRRAHRMSDLIESAILRGDKDTCRQCMSPYRITLYIGSGATPLVASQAQASSLY